MAMDLMGGILGGTFRLRGLLGIYYIGLELSIFSVEGVSFSL